MITNSVEYSNYLGHEYLPGRKQYLNFFYYPKILKEFHKGKIIIDMGCGFGEFLNFCASRKYQAIGVDSNPQLVAKCRERGLNVVIDNICELSSIKGQKYDNIICDNVIEHLDPEGIKAFLGRICEILRINGIFICIVPGKVGFRKDPTHVTYIDYESLERLIKALPVRITKYYCHPFKSNFVNTFLYLNMQVFVMTKVRFLAV